MHAHTQAHAITYFKDEPFIVHFNCQYFDILLGSISVKKKMQSIHYFSIIYIEIQADKSENLHVRVEAQVQAFWSTTIVLRLHHSCLPFGAEKTFQSLKAGPSE